ncbi:MAG TPA: asparagine synthase (glutamine-hydrolyzing) [Candidatus Polarisedimenticolaceae bacterium]|nr:asparagine synthase (glutamine-hydrolyzing) [Candidatus Polarisedimenticolaceae bacterium]
MCGIAGIVGRDLADVDPASCEAMLATLRRRGPDDRGTLAFPHCILLHTRLSILDLATGGQPMRDARRNVAITFNGEIYNFQEVKRELAARGHEFATRSDTEVILKAYLEYGSDCPQHLDGMFAFGIWDEERQTLLLARDRFGKKPLYWAHDAAGNLLFASEIKTLLASGRIAGQLDYGAVDAYLRLTYVPPARTVYRDVHVVRPAETLTLAGGALRRRSYWSLERRPLHLGRDEARERLRALLDDAVRKRMVADVEIGALLSGGVDSTIVTDYAQRSTTRPIKTFSVGYGDYINELPYSQAAAERIGTDHTTLQVGGAELADDLQAVAAYFDEPHADSSNVSQFLVSRLARTRVKVALCGDGGDEVFLGYPWYWHHRTQGRAFRLRQALLSSPFRDYVQGLQLFGPQQRRALWGGEPPDDAELLEPALRGRFGGVERINRFDLTVYLPGQLLVKADRAGMMNSLEVRSPLLDHRLAEFAFNLPLEYKTDGANGKLLLKQLLAELLPAEFVHRKKQGFGAPVRDWLKTICRPLVHDLLAASDARVHGFLERGGVAPMIERFYTTDDASDYGRIWVLLCLELWLRAPRAVA